MIDVPRRLGKSALSLQVRACRGDSITFGIENRDLITVVVLVVKYELVSVIAMAVGGHFDFLRETRPRPAASPSMALLLVFHLQVLDPIPLSLTQESVCLMPLKSFFPWPLFGMAWHQNVLTVHRIIVTTILEVFLQATPDLKPAVIADGHIT